MQLHACYPIFVLGKSLIRAHTLPLAPRTATLPRACRPQRPDLSTWNAGCGLGNRSFTVTSGRRGGSVRPAWKHKQSTSRYCVPAVPGTGINCTLNAVLCHGSYDINAGAESRTEFRIRDRLISNGFVGEGVHCMGCQFISHSILKNLVPWRRVE